MSREMSSNTGSNRGEGNHGKQSEVHRDEASKRSY